MTHCDDLIEDPAQPECLRKFLEFNRRQAIHKTGESPTLFAVLTNRKTPIPGNSFVRVVMASRFGDVGITRDLTAKHGYECRVLCNDLTDFSETPE